MNEIELKQILELISELKEKIYETDLNRQNDDFRVLFNALETCESYSVKVSVVKRE